MTQEASLTPPQAAPPQEVSDSLELARLYALPVEYVSPSDVDRVDELSNQISPDAARLASRLGSEMSERDRVRSRVGDKITKLIGEHSQAAGEEAYGLAGRIFALHNALFRDSELEGVKHAHARAQLHNFAKAGKADTDMLPTPEPSYGGPGTQTQEPSADEEPVVSLPFPSRHSTTPRPDQQRAAPDNGYNDDEHHRQPDPAPQPASPAVTELLDEIRGMRQDAADRDARDLAEADRNRERERALLAQQRADQQAAQADRRQAILEAQDVARQKAENRRPEQQLLSGNVYDVDFEIDDPASGEVKRVKVRMRAQGDGPDLDAPQYAQLPGEEIMDVGTTKEKQYRMLVQGEGLFDDFEIVLPKAAFTGMESYNLLDDDNKPLETRRRASLDTSERQPTSGRALDMLRVLALTKEMHAQLSLARDDTNRRYGTADDNPLFYEEVREIAENYQPYAYEIYKRFERTRDELVHGPIAHKLRRFRSGPVREGRGPRDSITVWQRDMDVIRDMFNRDRLLKMYTTR